MPGKSKNKIIRYRGSAMLILLLLAVWFVFPSPHDNSHNCRNKPLTSETSVSNNSGTVAPCLRMLPFKISSISNKDCFELLSFGKSQFRENIITAQRIITLEKIRNKAPQIYLIFIQCRHLPRAGDELPVLS